MLIANAAQIREADRLMAEEFAYPTLLLMETAGRKAAEFLIEHYPHTRNFLILCGPSNNGGDGLVTARPPTHRSLSHHSNASTSTAVSPG